MRKYVKKILMLKTVIFIFLSILLSLSAVAFAQDHEYTV